MPEPTKVYRLDASHEEMDYLARALNLVRAISANDHTEQIVDTINMHRWLTEDPSRVDRINAFRVRIGRVMLGDEKVDQLLKDMESEASATGAKRCPDCGGFHA